MPSDEVLQKIDAPMKHWRVPDMENAFEGRVVGKITAAERSKKSAEIEELRTHWSPSEDAMSLIEVLKSFVGRRMKIQFWDPIMYLLDDEGPNPVLGICEDVVIQRDGVFLQAYLVLNGAKEIPTLKGSPSINFLKNGKYAPLAKISGVSIMPCDD
jgi:hypothetical protein